MKNQQKLKFWRATNAPWNCSVLLAFEEWQKLPALDHRAANYQEKNKNTSTKLLKIKNVTSKLTSDASWIRNRLF